MNPLVYFFRAAFGKNEGFVCIARIDAHTSQYYESFFRWPEEENRVVSYVENNKVGSNVYFCPQILKGKRRLKETVQICPTLWADLDECSPDKLLVAPSIALRTSSNRYAALWVLEEPIDPVTGEELSQRIARYHAKDGCDQSGWDLSQLLRVPHTYNYKYMPDSPLVEVLSSEPTYYRASDFDMYPTVPGAERFIEDFPSELLNKDAYELFSVVRGRLPQRATRLFFDIPDGEWSSALWALELQCLEAGLSKEETFVVANGAACNKYKRDNRPASELWNEVCRAFARVENDHRADIHIAKGETAAELLTDEEREQVEADETFIERYIQWASSLGDAAPEYHQAGAFILLSALLAGNVRLPTSYGSVALNLWFMILGTTTLTRKSTSMDIATELLEEIDNDVLLATDGSVEGLLTSLSLRNNRPSIFLRDEFSGMLSAMSKKDYMSGMAEMFTKLYDGKTMKRVLRKDTITVKSPLLIMYTGGIESRITWALTPEDVTSGFMPRFIFIRGTVDPDRLRPLGPPTPVNLDDREKILDELITIRKFYGEKQEIRIAGNRGSFSEERHWDASLTPEAWALYNKFERKMVNLGMTAENADYMTPTYDRLSKSGLKVAVLIAASRMANDTVIVTELDVLHAFYYVEQWRRWAVGVLNDVGKSAYEGTLNRMVMTITRQPGITRGRIMQVHHLTSLQATLAIDTLSERGIIRVDKAGRGSALYPA